MSVEAGPPQQPPQLSPDGQWVWDGAKWRPIAGVAEPAHRGVFAAYTSIEVPEEPVAVAVQPVPAQDPAIDYSYTPPEVADPEAPLWNQPARSGITTYLYVGGALVVLVVGMMILNSMNFIQLPFGAQTASASPTPRASPSPTYPRSQYGRADQFLSSSLAPALDAFDQTRPAMLVCNGIMSNSCFDAINVSDPPMKNLLLVIDHGTIPVCIAAPLKKFQGDLAFMEGGLQTALKGYKDNQRSEVIDGIYRFTHFGAFETADVQALQSAQKQCSTVAEGP
ncbi:MAG TPA: hypothetical protein VLR46_06225 [Candidatus Dormibacteraeota bacterium]|nr:hypothetical protein [Candidatus Dormibacteraeota bacterium]